MPPLPPTWDGYHPLIVHLPIALLLVAPLFVLLAGATGKRVFMISALLLMGIGVGSAFVASNTGWEAYFAMEPDEDLEEEEYDLAYLVGEKHGQDAEYARNVFAGATGFYALIVLLAFVKPATAKLAGRAVTHLTVLGVLAWGNVLLANAAHLGGELVHHYGVKAPLGEPTKIEVDEEEFDEEELDENLEVED